LKPRIVLATATGLRNRKIRTIHAFLIGPLLDEASPAVSITLMPNSLDEECPMAAALAVRLRESKRDLTSLWLERISARVSIDPNRVFPTDELLDHVPLLIDGIADYVENPAAEISVDMVVVAKAMELGALRHKQGFDAYEILKEYEILGGILFHFFSNIAGEIDEPCDRRQLMACAGRLFRSVTIIQQATMTHFLLLADQRIAEREGRLRAFNRVLSHEIKNRVGAIIGASAILEEGDSMPAAERSTMLAMIGRNARDMRATVDNVLVMSQMEKHNVRQHRHVRLPEAAKEAVRQVREAAQAAGVNVRVDPDIADVEVNASVVELCIANYLSNAIKYADPNKAERFAAISATVEPSRSGETQVVIRVRDNGLKVPAEKRDRLFEEFFRAHETVTDAEGTGLGLSIVREAAQSQGGRAWVEHLDDGSSFALALPLRRKVATSETDEGIGPVASATA
jgi:signal transduction histidine kinase